MAEVPLVEFKYGWGQVVRLYREHLDVNGTYYVLSDLMYIRPVYRHTLGIASVRLELRFRQDIVVLRGIVMVEAAREMMRYLEHRHVGVINAQGQVFRPSPEVAIVNTASLPAVRVPPQQPFPDSIVVQSHVPTLPDIPYAVQQGQDMRVRKLRRSIAERARKEHGFDVEKLALRLKEEPLPVIDIPLRLLPGEYAHYSVAATWCGDPLPASSYYRYRVKDQGMLTLSNLRMIYLGRKSQIVLGYHRLIQASRVQGALVLRAEQWNQQEIFEVELPLECTMYLECILRNFKQHHLIAQQHDAEINRVAVSSVEVEERQAAQPVLGRTSADEDDTLVPVDTEQTDKVALAKKAVGSSSRPAAVQNVAQEDDRMEWLEQLGWS